MYRPQHKTWCVYYIKKLLLRYRMEYYPTSPTYRKRCCRQSLIWWIWNDDWTRHSCSAVYTAANSSADRLTIYLCCCCYQATVLYRRLPIYLYIRTPAGWCRYSSSSSIFISVLLLLRKILFHHPSPSGCPMSTVFLFSGEDLYYSHSI